MQINKISTNYNPNLSFKARLMPTKELEDYINILPEEEFNEFKTNVSRMAEKDDGKEFTFKIKHCFHDGIEGALSESKKGNQNAHDIYTFYCEAPKGFSVAKHKDTLDRMFAALFMKYPENQDSETSQLDRQKNLFLKCLGFDIKKK